MKVLLAAAEGDRHFDLIKQLDIPGLQVVDVKNKEDIDREIIDADVMYGFPSPAQVESALKLKWLQSPGAGVDWAARMPQLVESDIILTNTRGAHGPSIAEHVFAMLFYFTKAMPQCIDWQRAKYWGRDEGYRLLDEINGGTMGIIGYGQIGQAVGKRAIAMGMKVLAVDINPPTSAPHVDEVWGLDRLHDMLGQSDVVVVAVPYTPLTRHMIDAAAFAAMKPGAYLVAISRGGIIEEGALVEALKSGRLAGCGTDVAEQEPLPQDSPLWDAPNLFITPHLAGASDAKERRCVEIFRDNLVRYAKGEPLTNLVDKRLGY